MLSPLEELIDYYENTLQQLENLFDNVTALNTSKGLESIILTEIVLPTSIYITPEPQEVDPDNPAGANVVYVGPMLTKDGKRICGYYNPQTHTIAVDYTLSPEEQEFTYYHEVWHSLNLPGSRNEALADQYAASRVGYNPFYASAA